MKLIYPRLPEGYAELEYIEGTGEQYIDLGMKGNLNTEVEVRVNKKTASTSSTVAIFGDVTDGTKAIDINIASDGVSRNSRFGDVAVASGSYYFPLNQWKTVRVNKSLLSVDGVSLGSFSTTTPFETVENLLLFRVEHFQDTYSDGITQIAYCKIWSSGTLVRHMIPAQRNADSAVGMYDLVNDVFYGNAGTGAFVAGPKLHYVKGIAYKPGINLWDETWEGGTYDKDTGAKKSQAGAFRSKGYIAVTPNTEYYCYCGTQGIRVYYYEADKTYIGTALADNTTITTPADCYFMTFYSGVASYSGDITINLSDPDINGHYYPYAKAIKKLATAGRTFWAKLPSAYRPVKYLESTGTQYIDTGIKPTSQTKVFARLQLNSSDANVGLFGAWQAETNSRYNLWTFTGQPNTTTFGYGDQNGSGTYLPFAVGQMLDVACYIQDGEVYWRTGEEEAHYPVGAFVEPNLNMFLFTRNRNGEAQNPAKLRCAKFTVYQGTSLVQDLVPVVRVADGVAGMYDLVSNTFITNAGTGAFIPARD